MSENGQIAVQGVQKGSGEAAKLYKEILVNVHESDLGCSVALVKYHRGISQVNQDLLIGE